MIRISRVFFMFWFAAIFAVPPLGLADAYAAQINCDIQSGPCNRRLNDAEIRLDIQPRPVTAMEDLLFRVSLSGQAGTEAPYIDLGMPGMKMGPNRVRLKQTAADVFEGRGVIVRCPSGKTVWEALVTIPGQGQVSFIFNVVY